MVFTAQVNQRVNRLVFDFALKAKAQIIQSDKLTIPLAEKWETLLF